MEMEVSPLVSWAVMTGTSPSPERMLINTVCDCFRALKQNRRKIPRSRNSPMTFLFLSIFLFL